MIRISINTDDPSKAEEKALIEKLFFAFRDTNTYLKDLFTNDFFGWVCNQIDNDFPPDLYGWGFGDSNSLRAEIEDLKKEIGARQFEKVELEESLLLKGEKVEKLTETVGQLYEDKSDLEDIIDKKADAIDALELEVAALKAKIYDLITKED